MRQSQLDPYNSMLALQMLQKKLQKTLKPLQT
jgi:hypothetical protein